MLSGPIALYLSSNVLIDDKLSTEPDAAYALITPRFFMIYAYVPCWALGVEQIVGLGVTGSSVFTAATAGLVLALAVTRRSDFHRYGVAGAWALFAVALGLRLAGAIR